jgi:hypothetical protein
MKYMFSVVTAGIRDSAIVVKVFVYGINLNILNLIRDRKMRSEGIYFFR